MPEEAGKVKREMPLMGQLSGPPASAPPAQTRMLAPSSKRPARYEELLAQAERGRVVTAHLFRNVDRVDADLYGGEETLQVTLPRTATARRTRLSDALCRSGAKVVDGETDVDAERGVEVASAVAGASALLLVAGASVLSQLPLQHEKGPRVRRTFHSSGLQACDPRVALNNKQRS